MILLLDAAMGTALLERLPQSSHAERTRAARHAPELVTSIHREHLEAGARVLTTHTFGAHTFDDDELVELSTRAVALLQSLRTGVDATLKIAGSIGPLPRSVAASAQERTRRYAALTRALARAGVDVLRIETMTGWDDARLAVQACSGLSLPVWLGLACGADGRLLGGEPLAPPGDLDARVALWIVQCTERSGLAPALRELGDGRRRLGLAPSTGRTTTRGFVPDAEDELELARHVVSLATGRTDVDVVGGCCGTTARYLATLRDELG